MRVISKILLFILVLLFFILLLLTFSFTERASLPPLFTNYPAIRHPDPTLGKILSDIDSHMPANHIYKDRDKITWAHETSHGIAARLRSQYGGNAFYVLNDRAVLLKEPNTTLREVANRVPQSLRGSSYRLYLIDQQRYWNNQPLYICDEWVAYANGAATRAELKISSRGETVTQMLEFAVYTYYMGMPIELDSNLKSFIIWHTNRVMIIYEDNLKLGGIEAATAYLTKLRITPDGQDMRDWLRKLYESHNQI